MTKRAFTRGHHLSEENLKHNNKVEDELLKRTARSEEHLRLDRLNLSYDDVKRSTKADKGEKSKKVVKGDKTKTPKSSKKVKDETPQSSVDVLASGGHNNVIPQGMVPLPYVSMVPPYHQAFAYPGAPGGQMMQQQGMMHPMMQAQLVNAQAMQSQMMAPQMMSTHMAHPQLMPQMPQMPQMMPQGMAPGFGYMQAAYPQQAQYQSAYGANIMYTGNPAYPYVLVESPTRHVTEQDDIYEDDHEDGQDEESEEQTEEEASTTGYEDSTFSD